MNSIDRQIDSIDRKEKTIMQNEPTLKPMKESSFREFCHQTVYIHCRELLDRLPAERSKYDTRISSV